MNGGHHGDSRPTSLLTTLMNFGNSLTRPYWRRVVVEHRTRRENAFVRKQILFNRSIRNLHCNLYCTLDYIGTLVVFTMLTLSFGLTIGRARRTFSRNLKWIETDTLNDKNTSFLANLVLWISKLEIESLLKAFGSSLGAFGYFWIPLKTFRSLWMPCQWRWIGLLKSPGRGGFWKRNRFERELFSKERLAKWTGILNPYWILKIKGLAKWVDFQREAISKVSRFVQLTSKWFSKWLSKWLDFQSGLFIGPNRWPTGPTAKTKELPDNSLIFDNCTFSWANRCLKYAN